jgi:hypothetical protein
MRTRDIISNVFLIVGLLLMLWFVIQHFMTPRPSWHTDLVWIGIACTTLSRIIRGRPRWRRSLE